MRKQIRFSQVLVLVSFIMSLGCEESFQTNSLALQSNLNPMDSSGLDPDVIDPIEDNDDQDQEDHQDSDSEFSLSICSKLEFDQVAWPKSMDDFERNSYALAMNITGSFEGHDGWENIANNFDGQGLSLGLFNQNLGQGTLQPLFNRVIKDHEKVIKKQMSSAQYTSLTSMLKSWGSTAIVISAKASATDQSYSQDFTDLDDPSSLEDSDFNNPFFLQKASNSQNQKSVDWAVRNLYSGSKFISSWKTALQKVAGTPEYITLQVAAASAIHNKAMGYMEQFGFRQLRTYLFFFDIVVQNGGIPSSINQKYLTWVRSNSKASELTKALKLLELRLTVVRPQYVNDVRSRKTSILNGEGVVHGSRRNYVREYCAPSLTLNF